MVHTKREAWSRPITKFKSKIVHLQKFFQLNTIYVIFNRHHKLITSPKKNNNKKNSRCFLGSSSSTNHDSIGHQLSSRPMWAQIFSLDFVISSSRQVLLCQASFVSMHNPQHFFLSRAFLSHPFFFSKDDLQLDSVLEFKIRVWDHLQLWFIPERQSFVEIDWFDS